VADGFAEGGAAGLAGEEDLQAGGLKVGDETLDLGGLSASFGPLECDEDSGRLGHGAPM
jgi:hypothetical protein